MTDYNVVYMLWSICVTLKLDATARFAALVLFHSYTSKIKNKKFYDEEIVGASILISIKLQEANCPLNDIVKIISNIKQIDAVRLKERIVLVEMNILKKYGFFIKIENGYKILAQYLKLRDTIVEDNIKDKDYNIKIIKYFNDLICCKSMINFSSKDICKIAIKLYYRDKYNIVSIINEEETISNERDMLLIWSKGKEKEVGVEKQSLIGFFNKRKKK